MPRDAVIVSTARTPIGRAYKGAFNATSGPTLGSLALKPAIERAGIDAGEIDDVVWGTVLTQGTQFGNIGRQVALRAGCPVSVSGMTIDRQCSSGLMAIATAAKQIITDKMDVVAAGGQDSISLVQTPEMRIAPDPSLIAMHKHVYMPMLQTAETAARRYNISRERQDEYALKSQQRTAAAQAAGRFDDEIVPATTTMAMKDKDTGEVSMKEITVSRDEGNRADTTLEGLSGLNPVLGPDTSITAGNASQLSDGSSASILMEAGEAARRGLAPMGRYVGMAVAGTEPDEMGIGPIDAELPSDSWLAFPAVIDVSGPRTGLSPDRPSRVVSARLPSSLDTVISRCETSLVSLSTTFMVVVTGTISASKRPSACAAAVRCWLFSAYSSCRSRLMP